MSTTIIRPADRQEWLKYRSSGIGSSEVATIVGLNPFETPYQLWRRKMGIDAPKEETFAMKAGHYLEPAVAKFWEDATGLEVDLSSEGDWLIVDDAKPYLRVSPDRLYWLDDAHTKTGILECKTTQKTIDPDNLPRHWFCQVQYQLGVARIEQGSIGWLTQGREFGYQDLRLVPDFFGWLIEQVDRFWVDNILGGKAPAESNIQDIILKYPQHVEGKTIEAGAGTYEVYDQLKSLRREISVLEDKKIILEDEIKLAFGDAEVLSYGGQTLATFKAPKATAKFDAKAFKEDHPDLAREYSKPSQGARRLLIR